MNPSFIDGSRASVSALVLILLLSWESFAPYFEFFVHRTSDRVRHATRTEQTQHRDTERRRCRHHTRCDH